MNPSSRSPWMTGALLLLLNAIPAGAQEVNRIQPVAALDSAPAAQEATRILGVSASIRADAGSVGWDVGV